jgi:tRNA threonylcarbamoyladenosine biosynthesis protein TsaB
MNLLGLDTSTPATAACLLRDDGEAFEVVPSPAALFERPGHARELMPALVQVVEEAGLTFGDLDAVAVGLGPGTFTGLRIGIATARAIASARSLPVHGVSSLAALAAGAGDGPALAVIDARRREVFAALYADGEERWAPFVAAPGELARLVVEAGGGVVAVGDGAVRFRAELEAVGARVPAGDDLRHVVRALHVCRLARTVPPAAPEGILPDYLRSPDAVPPAPTRSP